MPKAVYQIRDASGAAQGGRVFIAPDDATLMKSVGEMLLPEGWTFTKVEDESQIIAAPVLEKAEEA